MELFLNILVLLSPALIGLFGYGMLKLSQLISSKVKNEALQGILLRLDDSVETAVKSIFQSYVDTLKKEGKFDKSAQAAAKTAAIQDIKSYFGPKGLEELQKIMGWKAESVEEQLSNKVEAKISDLKNQ